MYINDLDIQITLATKPLTQAGFSKILILGERAAPSDLISRYEEFSEPSQMLAAGFKPTDPEYIMASLVFGQSPSPSEVAVYVYDKSAKTADALSELCQKHNDWYGLLVASRKIADQHAAGDFALGNEKMFIGCSDKVAILDKRNNKREAYLIHNEADKYPEAAWAGLCFPPTPGSITWKYQCPTGVNESNFDLKTLNEIRKNNGQTLSKRSGVVYSDEGITTGGEYIDVIMSRDFVKARLSEAIFGLKIRNGKIPFDETGAAMLEDAIRGVLHTAGGAGIIAGAVSEEDQKLSDNGDYMYMVNVPSRSEVPQNDRASRNWSGITFEFVIAGAVHSASIKGTINV